MIGLNNPIGYKSIQHLQKPFIINPFRFSSGGGIGGWIELGRTTLGGSAATMAVSGLADKKYYMVLINSICSGLVFHNIQFNSDTGNNYAYRYSDNGGGDGTLAPNTSTLFGSGGSTTQSFSVGYIANLTGQEKLVAANGMNQSSAGSGTAPARRETVGKWVPVTASDVIDEFVLANGAGGNLDTGSEVVVLGWDPDDEHTDNFWEELASVNESSGQLDSLAFTAKKYLWIQAWLKPASGTWNGEVRVGNTTIDTGTNYANRQSGNGGTDATSTNVDKLFNSNGISSIDQFVNIFIINNASNEKLAIGHSVEARTLGASTAPDRNEMVGKWNNTSNQMDRISISKTSGSGVMDSTSILKVWGHD
tara:strand:+ start:486 stop:1577 length:1092 start_codon:yes stop_codon:yes gene_type:complete